MSGVSAECAARYEPRQLLERFYAKFGGTSGARVAAAPGRANLIGEHTDYQEGLVLPFAIEQRAFVVFRAKAGASLFAYAEDLDEFAEFDLGAAREDAFGPQIEPKWLRRVALRRSLYPLNGCCRPLDCGIRSRPPTC
ncbi:Galactokinase galactose-binding signature-domain-containing protein [Pelagophyceae sp. CCMP2097]|nr:hypothetical protein M885DRAFT_512274 [Pelagophyceae sp. CCMP2097]KAJ1459148.1 Galactokinase galactose-binding signature-domain-containing protein [Pelagophyceae sp. CCMP2097]